MRKKDHCYGADGPGLVELRPVRRGVEISITEAGPDGDIELSSVLSLEEFRELLCDGLDVIRQVDALRDEAMRMRGLTRGNGGC
ncbi:hypothetical protein [Saccharopolyspora phatthalungensis]|uniref:Uncharacterized protein n=1 Tax=Saccharopolyspora phatthalungensis TaxID=664693 RepID=A0A840PXZ0_9PSEU|nr:hypothetical protein [Saccharopolyspora phatthalungensis]MBB5153176.1 hypothetical protein [Saccharopolyspora phatthalungensis]